MTYLILLDGMCCTFNSGIMYDPLSGHTTKYDRENTRILYIYTFEIYFLSNRIHEPLRVTGNGYRMGLSLVIDAKLDDYSVTTGKFDGFKVSYIYLKLEYLSFKFEKLNY